MSPRRKTNGVEPGSQCAFCSEPRDRSIAGVPVGKKCRAKLAEIKRADGAAIDAKRCARGVKPKPAEKPRVKAVACAHCGAWIPFEKWTGVRPHNRRAPLYCSRKCTDAAYYVRNRDKVIGRTTSYQKRKRAERAA